VLTEIRKHFVFFLDSKKVEIAEYLLQIHACDILFALTALFFCLNGSAPLVGQDLLIDEASVTHSNTPHSVGLLWTRDQPVEDYLTTHKSHDRHPCSRRDSNRQSQQTNVHSPTP
jgi:hypothetical protein